MIPTLDPVIQLARARRRYLVRTIISILCIAVLLGIDMEQADRLEKADHLEVANERAIAELVKSSKALTSVCSPLINPPLPEPGCYKQDGLLICAPPIPGTTHEHTF